MAKGNRKARFSMNNLFNTIQLNLKFKRMFIRYLNHDDIVHRTKQVVQVLKEIKQRKQIDKHMINVYKYNRQSTKKQFKPDKLTEQIQYDFDICKWWNEQHE